LIPWIAILASLLVLGLLALWGMILRSR